MDCGGRGEIMVKTWEYVKRKDLPTTGIEPATTGLRVLCSAS